MGLRLLVFLGGPVVIFLGAFLLMEYAKTNPAMKEALRDTLLEDLQARHPNMTIEDEFSRIAVYWFQEASSDRKVAIPKSELEGATVRFVKCDLAQIPTNVLYPNRKDITCFKVDNPEHRLEAYFFHSKDGAAPMVEFFERNVDPDKRLGMSRHSSVQEETWRKPFTHELICYYFLRELGETWGFVAYREEKHR